MLTFQDLPLVVVLAFLEGVLSIDNALVLALQVRGLPRRDQRRALTYGLAGAVAFRFIALFFVVQLVQWSWTKWIGGGYLAWLALSHLLRSKPEAAGARPVPGARSFWKTVVKVELTDVVFAIDSILAAVALSNKLAVVFVGGVLGIVMMRFASTLFVRLLERFPAFESAAYLMVLVIGVKLLGEAAFPEQLDFHSISSPAFWAFWGLLLAAALSGFRPPRRRHG